MGTRQPHFEAGNCKIGTVVPLWVPRYRVSNPPQPGAAWLDPFVGIIIVVLNKSSSNIWCGLWNHLNHSVYSDTFAFSTCDRKTKGSPTASPYREAQRPGQGEGLALLMEWSQLLGPPGKEILTPCLQFTQHVSFGQNVTAIGFEPSRYWPWILRIFWLLNTEYWSFPQLQPGHSLWLNPSAMNSKCTDD